MGFLDKIRNLVRGRSDQMKGGIDKGAGFIGDKAGKHADRVDAAAGKAKEGVDKLAGK